eukprot:142276-Amphidinium_carterae.1
MSCLLAASFARLRNDKAISTTLCGSTFSKATKAQGPPNKAVVKNHGFYERILLTGRVTMS